MALDAAISMLTEDNPFLANYNKITKAGVIGGQPYDSSRYELQGPPLFSKEDPSLEEVMNGLQSGDYLFNKVTGEIMICIGVISVRDPASESVTSLNTCDYPIVLHKERDGARISVIGIPVIVFNGFEVIDLQMEDWTEYTWFFFNSHK